MSNNNVSDHQGIKTEASSVKADFKENPLKQQSIPKVSMKNDESTSKKGSNHPLKRPLVEEETFDLSADLGSTPQKKSDLLLYHRGTLFKTKQSTKKKKTESQLEEEKILSLLDVEDQSIQENPHLFETSKNSQNKEDFAQMLVTVNDRSFLPGDVVSGVILDVQKDFVLVDINYKSEGLIPISEFQEANNNNNEDKKITIGRQIDVYIEHLENDDGMVVLSKSKADMLKAWQDISKVAENDEIIEGTVLEQVKGGLSVDIGVKAFLPGSQIDMRPVKSLNDYVGKTLEFKIIKFNKKRGNIVLSRRAVLEDDRDNLKLKYQSLEDIKGGDTVVGVVKNITDYGAFIGLGGLDGLLHITDMSWKRIKHPSEILQVGSKIEVKVLRYDEENGRVSLGLKQMQPDPWQGVRDSFPIGSKTKGRIVSLADYGAFVELKDGVEGLIHVSEMSWVKRVKHPSECVSVNQVLDVMVLDVDSENRRISLGVKQLKENPWQQLKKVYEPGTIIEGEVKSVTDFGVFIGVEDNIDGLVHISDFSWTKRVHHPLEMFKKGDKARAVVLGLDVEHERFSLGIKQLEPDPWIDIDKNFSLGQTCPVTVVKIADFGVFVKITSNLEGLIHISEIPKERSEKLKDVLKLGDKLEAVIVNIDKKARKIALSAKPKSQKADDGRPLASGRPTDKSSRTNLGDIFGETLKQATDKKTVDKKSSIKTSRDKTSNKEAKSKELESSKADKNEKDKNKTDKTTASS